MLPKLFIQKYLPFALVTEQKTGIHHDAILVQAAAESTWGDVAPGNEFFGQKDFDGINGNEQLLITTEYSRRSDLEFPVIISVTPVVRNGVKMFKYKVKDYFRKYDTPEECFTDHANFLLANKRYAKAISMRNDAEQFLRELAKAGYATAPNYETFLVSILKTIQKNK